VQDEIDNLRVEGRSIICGMSKNGFAADRRLAERLSGFDVIFSSGGAPVLPIPELVGQTYLVASGGQGRFLSRIDIEVDEGRVIGLRHKLIPTFADLIRPDPDMQMLVHSSRAPFAAELASEFGPADRILYRDDGYTSPWDDIFCGALMQAHDTPIALTPGFQWGNTVLPNRQVTYEDTMSICALPDGASYRQEVTGAALRAILETAAGQVFGQEPFGQTDRGMTRVGSVGLSIAPNQPYGKRIGNMRLISNGKKIEDGKIYPIAGWHGFSAASEGTPVWQILKQFQLDAGHQRLGQITDVSVI
jgi:sulfur-oxidizing protein SoxB